MYFVEEKSHLINLNLISKSNFDFDLIFSSKILNLLEFKEYTFNKLNAYDRFADI